MALKNSTLGNINNGFLSFVDGGRTGMGLVIEHDEISMNNPQIYPKLIYDSIILNKNVGTVDFWLKPIDNINTTILNHFFEAAVENHSFSIVYYWEQFHVFRDLDGKEIMILFPYHLEKDNWYRITLTWDDTITKFYINGEEISNKYRVLKSNFISDYDFIEFSGSDIIFDNVNITADYSFESKIKKSNSGSGYRDVNEKTTQQCDYKYNLAIRNFDSKIPSEVNFISKQIDSQMCYLSARKLNISIDCEKSLDIDTCNLIKSKIDRLSDLEIEKEFQKCNYGDELCIYYEAITKKDISICDGQSMFITKSCRYNYNLFHNIRNCDSFDKYECELIYNMALDDLYITLREKINLSCVDDSCKIFESVRNYELDTCYDLVTDSPRGRADCFLLFSVYYRDSDFCDIPREDSFEQNYCVNGYNNFIRSRTYPSEYFNEYKLFLE